MELIRESPYLQYFIGLPVFTETPPFSARSMAAFRARIPEREVARAAGCCTKIAARRLFLGMSAALWAASQDFKPVARGGIQRFLQSAVPFFGLLRPRRGRAASL